MQEEATYLTDSQLDELTRRFKAKETPSALISEFNLNVPPNQLYKYLPPEVLEEKCRYCSNSNLKRKIPSQNGPGAFRRLVPYCSSCGHQQDGFCRCKNCIERRANVEEMKGKQELHDLFLKQKEGKKISIKDLSLTYKLYLGAILQEGISEDNEYIKPIDSFINPLAPTDKFSIEIIKRLFLIEAIVVHPDTELKFIEIADYNNGKLSLEDFYHVKWSLNVKSDELDKVALIESLINPKDIDDSEYYEASLLWKKIGLYESIEYFKYNVHKFLRIDCKIGDKTKTVFNDLTNYYSVAQIYGIIYEAVLKAIILRAEEGFSKKRTLKEILGYMQIYGESARLKNLDLQKHSRSKNCTASALSKFFFEKVIKIGSEGFSEVPNISKIQNKLSPTEVVFEIGN